MYILNLHKEQFIDKPIEEVFKFFENPNNLEKITPSHLKFKILSNCPKTMIKGLTINYQIKLFKVPFKWKTVIKHYNPPHMFIDEQIKGPYEKWVHTHLFKSKKGGTLICDKVEYIIPLGIFGYLLNFIWIKYELNRIFNYRRYVIDSYFNKNGELI